uniref:Insulin-like domain-containing protein n=1 Tax=Periophthalmus magnuspinnatus TaxID=409849 RepID=A0A3B4AWM0_9GOBI
MSGLKRVLCLTVVVVGLVVVGVVVEVEGHESIKMCGRDLIRHAVSYCGNSRLRRAVPMPEAPQQRGENESSHTGSLIDTLQ